MLKQRIPVFRSMGIELFWLHVWNWSYLFILFKVRGVQLRHFGKVKVSARWWVQRAVRRQHCILVIWVFLKNLVLCVTHPSSLKNWSFLLNFLQILSFKVEQIRREHSLARGGLNSLLNSMLIDNRRDDRQLIKLNLLPRGLWRLKVIVDARHCC